MQRKFFNVIVVIMMAFTFCTNFFAADRTQDKSELKSREFWIGNFLADKGHWSTHVLMSDYISDELKQSIIKRCKEHSLNRIHIYGVNDDNYSQRRGGDTWKGIPNRALEYSPEKFDHWFHWFTMCRKTGMHITLWLWPNDARKTYNNEGVWDDDRVVAKMKQLIEFSKTPYESPEGTVDLLVDELVLKLEADDEWTPARINRIAKRIRPFLHKDQTLWYHNQLIKDTLGVDWNLFDGIRIQTGHRRGIWETATGGWSEEGLKTAMREIIEQLPGSLKIYFSEFTLDGFKESNLGTVLLRDLPKEYPGRIYGSDNGGHQP
jgi:hypothetical protein